MMTTPPPAPEEPQQDAVPQPGQDPQYPAPPSFPNYPGGTDYGYGGYGAPPAERRNGMGVAALVLGLVGFLIGPASILAIVFGRIGLNRASRNEASNRGVAQAGFILGLVTLALWVLELFMVARR